MLLTDTGNNAVAHPVPFGRKTLTIPEFYEVVGRQVFPRYDEPGQNCFIAFGATSFDCHADRNRGAPSLRIRKPEADVRSGLLPFALILAQGTQTVIDHAPLRGAPAPSLVAGHGIETLKVPVSARQNYLGHV